MNIKGLIKNPIFKRYFYYVTLLITICTLVLDTILLTSLINGNSDCKEFENNKPLINSLLQKETNIARWDSSNVTFDYNELKTYYFPDLDTPAHVLDTLYIRRGGFFGSFSMSDRFGGKGFKSYAGVVGTANTSFPLVVPVAAADNDTTSYFAIREDNISLTPLCNVEIPNCFMTKQINFPFTFIQTDADVPNTDEPVSVASDNSTFSIYPGLRLYICQYTQNTANSYSWARQFAITTGILILTLELLKVVISLTSVVFLIRFKQPSIVNFANNSPIWFIILLRDFPGAIGILQAAMNLEETNSLQILSDTFLHSLPMLVLSIQSISYRFNEIKQPPPIITILSCAGSCAMLLFNFFRIYVSIKVTVPKQIEEFKVELSQYFDKHPKQKRQQYLLIFVLIDCAINLFPPVFMISLAVQGFKSVFVFIVPLLVIFAKLLICISMFWSQRFRKPLTSPLIFSFAMNSPIILLCIISSPLRQLITILAADGFTIWTGWPMDFISIDLPILVTLLMIRAFGHGNNQDVALLQQNFVQVIFATFYLVWRIISGLWYLRNSIITRDTNNKVHTRSTETFPFSYALKINRESSTAGIFIYTLSKLLIWIVGLQIIITMVFMSQPPSPNPEAYVTVLPKILMVLGLVIYLGFDVIGSLALLISYYGPFSTRTIALYLNSPFLIIFYILLGPQFRAEIITAAKEHVRELLLWKQRDIVLICSLLLIWPGFGFGYIPYGNDDRYSWWSWYGWGYDVKTKKVDNSVDPKWSFSGIFGAVYGLIYCVISILWNTVPIDELDKQE